MKKQHANFNLSEDWIFQNINKLRVGVIGDVMLDRYYQGEVTRISPEAPVPVVKVKKQRDVLGGASNVALNCRKMGAQVSLLGVVGEDQPGLTMHALLSEAGIKDELFVSTQGSTTVKSRILGGSQQLVRLDIEEDLQLSAQESEQLNARVENLLKNIDVLILSDYAKGVLKNAEQWIKIASDQGVPVLVDPKARDFKVYQGAFLLTPNWKEFTAVVGDCANEDDIIKKGQAQLQEHNVGALLVTRGAYGMTLITPEIKPEIKSEITQYSATHIATQAQEVFDVTGAGDTVIAFLAMAVGMKAPLVLSAKIANAAAGVVVSKSGSATVSERELRIALQNHVMPNSTILEIDDAVDVVTQIRDRGGRVAFTNGCFDLLHPGHVSYLEKAANLADCLIVGVNSDASVRRLKGAPRPMNELHARCQVLAGLRSVDWVVPFDEDTPENIISALLPDVLVKGGDYKIEDVVGRECVESKGGKVVIIDFVPGHSTTEIIKTIRETD